MCKCAYPKSLPCQVRMTANKPHPDHVSPRLSCGGKPERREVGREKNIVGVCLCACRGIAESGAVSVANDSASLSRKTTRHAGRGHIKVPFQSVFEKANRTSAKRPSWSAASNLNPRILLFSEAMTVFVRPMPARRSSPERRGVGRTKC